MLCPVYKCFWLFEYFKYFFIFLQSFFENNPKDLQVLRHDKQLHTVRVHRHLSDVPDYIVPNTLKHMAGATKNNKKRKNYNSDSKSKSIYKAKQNNPLLCAEIDFGKKRKA